MVENDGNEEWRPVVGYEGIYSVSSRGRVRCDIGGERRRAGHILKQYVSADRRCVIGLSRGRGPKVYKVHRLVAAAFLGSDGAREVNHKDGNPSNNAIENLEYVTRRENQRHAIDVLGLGRGELASRAKLTTSAVLWIRRITRYGIRQGVFSRLWGVDPSCISNAIRGRNWGHLR